MQSQSIFAVHSLVKRHRDRHIVMVHRLHRRMAHLLAFAPPRRRLRFDLLAIMLPETDIHVTLNLRNVGQDVSDHTLLEGPAEEVELAHRRLFDRRLAADLETDALAAAEGIEEALRIRLEFAFVVEMHHELTRTGLIRDRITDIKLLRVVRDEPVDEAETYRAGTGQNRKDLFQAPRLVIEVLEPTDNVILLALDAILQRLATGFLL